MKVVCVALALQAFLVLQVHCAGKQAATSDPKVTSQVLREVSRSRGYPIPAAYMLNSSLAHMQVFFDIEIGEKPAGKPNAASVSVVCAGP